MNFLLKGVQAAKSLLGGQPKPVVTKPADMKVHNSAIGDALAMNATNTKARRLLGR